MTYRISLQLPSCLQAALRRRVGTMKTSLIAALCALAILSKASGEVTPDLLYYENSPVMPILRYNELISPGSSVLQ